MKYIFYKRTGGRDEPVYFIRTQSELEAILDREKGRRIAYEREVLAESNDRDELVRFRRLLEGEG